MWKINEVRFSRVNSKRFAWITEGNKYDNIVGSFGERGEDIRKGQKFRSKFVIIKHCKENSGLTTRDRGRFGLPTTRSKNAVMVKTKTQCWPMNKIEGSSLTLEEFPSLIRSNGKRRVRHKSCYGIHVYLELFPSLLTDLVDWLRYTYELRLIDM